MMDHTVIKFIRLREVVREFFTGRRVGSTITDEEMREYRRRLKEVADA